MAQKRHLRVCHKENIFNIFILNRLFSHSCEDIHDYLDGRNSSRSTYERTWAFSMWFAIKSDVIPSLVYSIDTQGFSAHRNVASENKSNALEKRKSQFCPTLTKNCLIFTTWMKWKPDLITGAIWWWYKEIHWEPWTKNSWHLSWLICLHNA